MIRKLASAVAVVVALTGLAACGSSSNSSAKFCSEAKSAYANRDSILPRDATDSPNFDAALTEARKLQKDAPAAIKDEYATLVTALEDYKAGRLDAAIKNAPKIEAAARKIFDYLQNTCKITITEPATTSTTTR